MKKTFLAVIATAMALVSCHQPTKEEQLKEQVMVVFNDYAKENLKDKWVVDSIVFDTAGSSERYVYALQGVANLLKDNPRFASDTIISKLKQSLHIYDEFDTTQNVVAVVYVTLNKMDDTVFYCGIRHGMVHSPKTYSREALKDIHTPSEQAIYEANEILMISARAIRMFIDERDDFIYPDDNYNLWVNRKYRIDPQKLD